MSDLVINATGRTAERVISSNENVSENVSKTVLDAMSYGKLAQTIIEQEDEISRQKRVIARLGDKKHFVPLDNRYSYERHLGKNLYARIQYAKDNLSKSEVITEQDIAETNTPVDER